ncbi:hypothetical protein ACWD3W_32855, partial [Streptomyces sp. NPDC002644]
MADGPPRFRGEDADDLACLRPAGEEARRHGHPGRGDAARGGAGEGGRLIAWSILYGMQSFNKSTTPTDQDDSDFEDGGWKS